MNWQAAQLVLLLLIVLVPSDSTSGQNPDGVGVAESVYLDGLLKDKKKYSITIQGGRQGVFDQVNVDDGNCGPNRSPSI